MPKSENTRWFAEEVQPHEPSLRSYLRAVFPSFPDIDDLVQESYARLIRARETGTVGRSLVPLFTRTPETRCSPRSRGSCRGDRGRGCAGL